MIYFFAVVEQIANFIKWNPLAYKNGIIHFTFMTMIANHSNWRWSDESQFSILLITVQQIGCAFARVLNAYINSLISLHRMHTIHIWIYYFIRNVLIYPVRLVKKIHGFTKQIQQSLMKKKFSHFSVINWPNLATFQEIYSKNDDLFVTHSFLLHPGYD